MALTLLFGFGLFADGALAADTEVSGADRLVTIHDQGVERTIITKANTVKAALTDADISLQPVDVTEPSVETEFNTKNFNINVYRARPVTVIDGQRQTKVVTAEQSPRQIVAAAGGELHDEDLTSLNRVDNVLDGGGAGLILTVDRATSFMFNLYGKTFEARTQAATVGEMLKEKGVKLGSNDGQSVANETPLVQGMTVSVWRDGKQTATQEVPVAKVVEEVRDADRPVGFREVRTPGTDGKRQVTYEIEIRNGQEIARKEIASVTTLEPVKEIVVIGTKAVLPAGSHTDWMAAAGISPGDYGYVDYIVGRESGWNPTATNRSSGAHGLCQALPASKMATAGGDYMTNPITQLKWCNSYAVGRYGSWAAAYNFWISNHWW